VAGALILGPVIFENFEVPSSVRFGGQQRLAVHALPGGGRVVDAMGAQDGPLVWSGVFSGPNAAPRVRVLEALRRAGTSLPLAWSLWRYTVVIESFEADWATASWIPYRLQCCVVATEAAAVVDWLVGAAPGEIAALVSASSDVDEAAAEFALGGDDVAAAITASGTVARLNAGRALQSFPKGMEELA